MTMHRVYTPITQENHNVTSPHELARCLDRDEADGWKTLSCVPVFDRGNPSWGTIFWVVTQRKSVTT